MVLTGDYNFIPRSMLYRLFTTGKVELDVPLMRYSNQVFVHHEEILGASLIQGALDSLVKFDLDLADNVGKDTLVYPTGPNDSILTTDDLLEDLLRLEIVPSESKKSIFFAVKTEKGEEGNKDAL